MGSRAGHRDRPGELTSAPAADVRRRASVAHPTLNARLSALQAAAMKVDERLLTLSQILSEL